MKGIRLPPVCFLFAEEVQWSLGCGGARLDFPSFRRETPLSRLSPHPFPYHPDAVTVFWAGDDAALAVRPFAISWAFRIPCMLSLWAPWLVLSMTPIFVIIPNLFRTVFTSFLI